MSKAPNLLFPLVLDTLSHKPLFCETQANLLENVQEKIDAEGIWVNDLKRELQAAVDMGKGLGILTVQQEDVRIPFLLRRKAGNQNKVQTRGITKGAKNPTRSALRSRRPKRGKSRTSKRRKRASL